FFDGFCVRACWAATGDMNAPMMRKGRSRLARRCVFMARDCTRIPGGFTPAKRMIHFGRHDLHTPRARKTCPDPSGGRSDPAHALWSAARETEFNICRRDDRDERPVQL